MSRNSALRHPPAARYLALTRGHIPLIGLWLDFAGLGQGHFGEDWTKQFVNEDGEENDIPDDLALCPHLGGDGDRHAQGDASLGEQGNAQVFAHLCFCISSTWSGRGPGDFTHGPGEDVGDTDAHHGQSPNTRRSNSAPLSTKKRM